MYTLLTALGVYLIYCIYRVFIKYKEEPNLLELTVDEAIGGLSIVVLCILFVIFIIYLIIKYLP